MSLKGKVAMVTGSAIGIGKAIALVLAEKGADIAINDVDLTEAQKTAEDVRSKGVRCEVFQFDAGDYEQVEEGFMKAVEALGPIDILVNNAAWTTNQDIIEKLTIDRWDKEIRINLSGPFYCLKQVFPGMCERKWGRIVSISSVAGLMGGLGQIGYSSSKTGLIGFTKTIALEGAAHNVTANLVAPGVIGTKSYFTVPEKMRIRIEKAHAMRRHGDPEDIAHAVAYFASEEAKYTTGQVLIVGGGVDLFVF